MAVASAGLYASLHLAADRQPHQHPTTLMFFTGRMPFLPPNEQRQSTEGTNVASSNRQNPNVMNKHSSQQLILSQSQGKRQTSGDCVTLYVRPFSLECDDICTSVWGCGKRWRHSETRISLCLRHTSKDTFRKYLDKMMPLA